MTKGFRLDLSGSGSGKWQDVLKSVTKLREDCFKYTTLIFKYPNTSRVFLVRNSLYKLNKIGDKQRPCLPPLPFLISLSPLGSVLF
jgi:hypothetical protein